MEEICDKNHLKRSINDLYESDEEVKQPLNKRQKTYGLNKQPSHQIASSGFKKQTASLCKK